MTAREGKVRERIIWDLSSEEAAENLKTGREGKGISRAVIRSETKRAEKAQGTVTKNKFNWSTVKKLKGDVPESLTNPKLASSRYNLATSVIPLSLSRQWSL